MLDVVKFTWRNKHGYWIPAAWMLVPTEASEMKRLREYASTGRPGMTDMRVLSRAMIPEELRTSCRSSLMLSYVVLYDKRGNEYTADEMIDAMAARAAA